MFLDDGTGDVKVATIGQSGVPALSLVGVGSRLGCSVGGVVGCSEIITTESRECYKGSCRDVEWSLWIECDMGWFMMTRTRCHEDVCEEEYLECEVEGGGTWSEW